MKNKRDYFHSSIEIDTLRIIGDTTPFAIREAYRTFYTNVLYLPIEDKCKKIVITSMIDNLLKGAVGQAVQNMNIMFGIDERAGLNLKASAF